MRSGGEKSFAAAPTVEARGMLGSKEGKVTNLGSCGRTALQRRSKNLRVSMAGARSLGKEWTLCMDVCPGGAGGSPALVAHDQLEHGQRDRACTWCTYIYADKISHTHSPRRRKSLEN